VKIASNLETRESTEDKPEGEKGDKVNLISPGGFQKLKEQVKALQDERKVIIVEIQAAVKQGDRSENAEYQYGKKRLREIDKRTRFLNKRMESARVVEPTTQDPHSVRFGATVRVRDEDLEKVFEYIIVGEDEIDTAQKRISWKSPLGKGMLKFKVGDTLEIETPGRVRVLTILSIQYKPYL
jgi:transcription elongation factor GreB